MSTTANNVKSLREQAEQLLNEIDGLTNQFNNNTELQLAVQRINRRMHNVVCDLIFLEQ